MSALSDAIDRAVLFVRDHADAMTPAQIDEFGQLAQQVFVLAHHTGLERALPQIQELSPELTFENLPRKSPQFESKLHLPGDWDRNVPYEELILERAFLVIASDRWFGDMDALRALAIAKELEGSSEQGQKKASRTGRPRKNETGKGEFVLSMLLSHHAYEEDGSIGNYEPATVEALAALSKGAFSTKAASIYIIKAFGTNPRYKQSCRNKTIGKLLAKLRGEDASRDYSLRDDDYDVR